MRTRHRSRPTTPAPVHPPSASSAPSTPSSAQHRPPSPDLSDLSSSYAFISSPAPSSSDIDIETSSQISSSRISNLSSSLHSSVLDGFDETWMEGEEVEGDEADVTVEEVHTGEVGLAGSYVDAEATNTDLMSSKATLGTLGQSRGTLGDSQVRLIMPDPSPAESFMSTRTLENNKEKVLLPEEGSGRPTVRPLGVSREGLDEWLRESGSGSWDKEAEYMLLSSDDGIGATKADSVPTDESAHGAERGKGGIGKEWRSLARSLRGKKWPLRVSLITLASLVPLALYLSSSPALGPAPHQVIQPSTLASSTASLGATTASIPVPSSTHLIPDLQLIKQALSVYTTPLKGVFSEPTETDGAQTVDVATTRRKRNIRESTSVAAAVKGTNGCCSVSVRQKDETALSVPPSDSWPKSVLRKASLGLKNATHASSHDNVDSRTKKGQACHCGQVPSRHVVGDIWQRIRSTFAASPGHLAAIASQVQLFLTPAVIELQRELGEVVLLAKSLVETSKVASRFLLQRAVRGTSVTRRALDRLTERLRPFVSVSLPSGEDVREEARKANEHAQVVVKEAVELAKVSIEGLQEKLEEAHEQGVESLKQAKRGLDRLVRDAKALSESGNKADVEGEGGRGTPMPFLVDRGGKERMPKPRARAGRQRRECNRLKEGRREQGRLRGVVWKMEERRRRWMDIVHHGAMALVV